MTTRPGQEPTSTDYQVRSLPQGGQGVFAGRPFARGEVVLHFQGRVVGLEQVTDFTYFLEIGEGRFLGPSGLADDLVNHSCRPNTAVEGVPSGALLRAVRRIRRDEELTFDYSTVMIDDPTSFACHCAARYCRGRIVGWQHLQPHKRAEYVRRGMVPDFIARRDEGRSRPRATESPADIVVGLASRAFD
jgi:hypothetical protein